MGEYFKIWKLCKGQWLRTHLFWVRAGDILKIEGDDQKWLANSDCIHDPFKGPSVDLQPVNNVELEKE